ncbi:MAG TPA: hypothetical protein VMD59_13895 [Acidimicrobiales bacterium]|nr:hypothetical protein [Acidimicrobiales bacterium]
MSVGLPGSPECSGDESMWLTGLEGWNHRRCGRARSSLRLWCRRPIGRRTAGDHGIEGRWALGLGDGIDGAGAAGTQQR